MMATHVAHAPTVRGRATEASADLQVWWRAYGVRVLAIVAIVAVVAGAVLVVGIVAARWSESAAMFLGMVGILAAVVVAAWKWVGSA